jgi:hypothetical protein
MIALNWCETLFFTLKEESMLRALQNKSLRRTVCTQETGTNRRMKKTL